MNFCTWLDSKARILAVSPHPDDSEIGAGALIAKMSRLGVRTDVLVLCSYADRQRAEEVKDEATLSAHRLRVDTIQFADFPDMRLADHRQTLLDMLCLMRGKYGLVLTPARWDCHQDHKAATQEVIRAFKHTTILGYDMPWNHIDGGQPDCFVQISEEDLNDKLDALRCYNSQIALKRPYFQIDLHRSIAEVRGLEGGMPLAEAFECIRWRAR